MLRGMVFVDHMNFDIALQNLYKTVGKTPKLDYNTLFKGITEKIENIDYLKTILFVPTPDDFLMKDEKLLSYYKWTEGLKSSNYIDIISGRYIARPVDSSKPMDINDKNTYYKVEKGTDINMAVNILTKAFCNSFDIAFVVSGDTDYLTVYEQLKLMGKIIILVTVEGQSTKKLSTAIDDHIILRKDFFEQHIRPEKNKKQINN